MSFEEEVGQEWNPGQVWSSRIRDVRELILHHMQVTLTEEIEIHIFKECSALSQKCKFKASCIFSMNFFYQFGKDLKGDKADKNVGKLAISEIG